MPRLVTPRSATQQHRTTATHGASLFRQMRRYSAMHGGAAAAEVTGGRGLRVVQCKLIIMGNVDILTFAPIEGGEGVETPFRFFEDSEKRFCIPYKPSFPHLS